MKRLYINPITRTIEPKHRSLKAVHIARGDHNSALLRFEILQIVDGFDMSEATIQIHYANISGDGLYVSKGMSDAIEVVANDDTVTFAWKIPKTATRYAGVLSIGVTFEKYDNIDVKAEEIYSWSTAPYGEIVVCDSYDNSAEATEREYDYLVVTCNAIVEASLKGNLKPLFEEVAQKATEEATAKAKGYRDEADQYALKSISYSEGGTDTREGEDFDNAMHYSDMAKSWAVGDANKRENENTDNAKCYCEQAKGYSQTAGNSATDAQTAESKAEGYRDEAKRYRDEAEGYKNEASGIKTEVDALKSDVLDAKSAVDTAKSDIEAIRNQVDENVMYTQSHRSKAEDFRNEAEVFMAGASGHSGIAGDYARECETVYNKLLKALQSQVSGTGVVRLEDVNSGMSTAKVECSSSVIVTMYGKNLTNPEGTWQKVGVLSRKSREIYVPCDVVLTVRRKAKVSSLFVYKSNDDFESVTQIVRYDTDEEFVPLEITKEGGYKYRIAGTDSAIADIDWIQTEVGSVPTEYEAYKQSVTLTNLDEVELYSPTTTLIADSLDESITATYTKDINRTIERLENAIANS